MKIKPSAVSGIDLFGPGAQEFEEGLAGLLGRAPRSLIEPALPFSVIIANNTALHVAFFGIRFDMLGPRAKQYSVIHYADSLRNPERADFRPGGRRFMCVEPEYTSLVLRNEIAPATRGRMNLENLRKMLEIKASVDCVAFHDGCFAGPDSQGALTRLRHDHLVEQKLNEAVIEAASKGRGGELRSLLVHAVEDQKERARRSLGRKLLEAFETGGAEGAAEFARNYRYRIHVYRESERGVAVQAAP